MDTAEPGPHLLSVKWLRGGVRMYGCQMTRVGFLFPILLTCYSRCVWRIGLLLSTAALFSLSLYISQNSRMKTTLNAVLMSRILALSASLAWQREGWQCGNGSLHSSIYYYFFYYFILMITAWVFVFHVSCIIKTILLIIFLVFYLNIILCLLAQVDSVIIFSGHTGLWPFFCTCFP